MPASIPPTDHRRLVARRSGFAAALVAFLVLASLVVVAPAAAAGTRYYVDGKKGADSNSGTSLTSAFRTLERALSLARDGGVTISVVGYDGFTYFETLEKPYSMYGTSSSPVVIEGYRPPSGSFVRPTISGAKIVSRPGSGVWTRPDASAYPNVWRTPWTSPILGYESSRRTSRFDIVFMDGVNQLRRPSDKPSLAQLSSTPGSQYWDGKYLYVHLGTWEGGSIDKDPNRHLIAVPQYMGIAVNNDSSYVTIRDLRTIHTAGAISFYAGTHHGKVTDVELSYNFVVGLYSEGDDHVFTGVTGKRNGLQLVKLDRGAQRNVVTKAYASQHPGQGVKYHRRRHLEQHGLVLHVHRWGGSDLGRELRGRDPGDRPGAGDARQPDPGQHDLCGMGRGLMLYQYDGTGGPLKGNRDRAQLLRRQLPGRRALGWPRGRRRHGFGDVLPEYLPSERQRDLRADRHEEQDLQERDHLRQHRSERGPATTVRPTCWVPGTKVTFQNVIMNKGKGYGIYAGPAPRPRPPTPTCRR